MTFELDLKGGAEVLKELAAGAIKDLADQIAGEIGDAAVVKTSTTDRARASVTVPAEMQAKDGVLTRGASAAGLEVRPYPARKRKPKPRTSKAPKNSAGIR